MPPPPPLPVNPSAFNSGPILAGAFPVLLGTIGINLLPLFSGGGELLAAPPIESPPLARFGLRYAIFLRVARGIGTG